MAAPAVNPRQPTAEADALDLSLSPRGLELRERLTEFLETEFFPIEEALNAEMEALDGPEPFPESMQRLRTRAREAGLWNLYLTDPEHGAGLTNLDYGHLCELLGHSEWAPMAFNCNFPDTGNAEILLENASAPQRERWLEPALNGSIRSCFALTEPEVASSDPTALRTTARRDGDEWVIDGHKWFITGAIGASLCVTMVATDTEAERHRRLSVLLVPMDAPGLEIVRRVPLFGWDGGPGHCELRFDACRVPADAVLGEPGQGFQIAQDRLGPGRIHHCMRHIGAAERALEMSCRRALERSAGDGVLADKQLVQDFIARSRIEIDAARLLVLRAARTIDLHGKRAAYRDISIAKVHTARMAQDVFDRAIQVHGAGGLAGDVPLGRMWMTARALRIGDGADEVHTVTIAKRELRRYQPSDEDAAEGKR